MSIGKIFTIGLLLFSIYSAISVLDPKARKLTIEDVKVPTGKSEIYKKIITEEQNKKKSYDERNLKRAITKENKKQENNVISKDTLVIKIDTFFIQNDNLIADMYLYNNSKDNMKYNAIVIDCVGFEDGKAVDRFSWKSEINLKPKEVILVKNINLGYATARSISKIRCKIR